MNDDTQAAVLGDRSTTSERARLTGAVVLAITLVSVEIFVGGKAEREAVSGLLTEHTSWALSRYESRAAQIEIPPKAAGVKRILYLSNSHARTGGFVSSHLQQLLDSSAPGAYEILDMSSPGIFGPEILQRFLMALDYDIDAAVVPVAYISFADRMQLAHQSLSARSFFKPGVVERLDPGFWFRNYDLMVYANTAVARWSRLYHYRNRIRDYWEQPLVALLQRLGDNKNVRFLDVDERRSWQFPSGFDRTLFDWSLYALGREGHLADMRALVQSANQAGVPLFGANLPIHWEKEPRPRNEIDIALYRAELSEVFSGAALYVDYQDIFPKEFTTYDALHPTWHGARLHALDIALRLRANTSLLTQTTQETLVKTFNASDSGVSNKYREAVSSYRMTTFEGFRRYDYSDPEAAKDLMARLAHYPADHPETMKHLLNLAWRLRYWLETPFDYKQQGRFPSDFAAALDLEIERARERARYFQQSIKTLRYQQLLALQVPSNALKIVIDRRQASTPTSIERRFLLRNDNQEVVAFAGNTMRQPFALLVTDKKGSKSYLLTDPFGDGSFIGLAPPGSSRLGVPEWVLHKLPNPGWGT